MSDLCLLCKTEPPVPEKRYCASCSEKKRELASRTARAGGIAPGNSARAGQLAARSASRRRVLTLEDVELELPPLDSPANVRLAAQRVQRWSLAGLVHAGVASAAVRACEIALRALDSEFNAARLRVLEKKLASLEAERRGRT